MSLAFGSAKVRLLPEMTWGQLETQSLSEPRTERIAMELGAVRELGRYPHEPYGVRATPHGVERDPVVLAQHDRAEAALQAEVQRRLQHAPSGQVMLFVHGFNETFASSAYTAADLCHFMTNPQVSADLIELVVNGTPPGTPRRPLIREGKVTWVFPSSRSEGRQ